MTESATRREPKWAKGCLSYGPFDGDRDVTVRVLRDRIVIARKGGECQTCAEEIAPGSLIRSRSETCDGEIGTFRFCTDCCEAMAASWNDGGEAMEVRDSLGWRNRGRQP